MKLLPISLAIIPAVFMSVNMYAHQEVDIRLSEVPEKVMQTASNAKPGIKLTEAEKIDDNGKIIYELEGILDKFEFLISDDGTLLEVEQDY